MWFKYFDDNALFSLFFTIFLSRDYSADQRAKIGIKDNLVRFSFGVEKFEDLAADIFQALQNI